MSRTVTTVVTPAAPEPSLADLDGAIRQFERSLVTRLTVRRQSQADIGLRQIYVSLDEARIAVLCAGQEVTRELAPGPHRLRVHNTLFWRTCDFTVTVGEHVSFTTVNRKGPGTYSILAYFLGTNPIYLSLERDLIAGGA